MRHRLAVALVITAACVGCSSPQGQSAVSSFAPTSPSQTLSVSAPPGAQAVARVDVNGAASYFPDLLHHPDFASAFAAMSGTDQLPAWTSQGGTSTPAQRVELNGRPQLLAAACTPHDCPTERLLVLYDESTHVMSGLFARRKAGASNDIDSNDPIDDDLFWLGAPDDDAKHLLKQKLYVPD